ncbi:hypothetical protein GR223_23680 [Rhizobium leguminosarum]|uniref:hypothetical protein n=1 Tax=Rhizobium ruizarguesonis TaxID=2081791 RepID=UPI0013E07589|nr:hypothetical protein [Rhizobium ruizarguesonis]NEJ88896.1 hypothetical protein [Rhizobium ruizarguesonis]
MIDDDSIRRELEFHLERTRSSEPVKAALAMLFPRLSKILDVSAVEAAAEIGKATGYRLANRDYSRSYFRLTPDSTVWGKSFIESLAASEPKRAFETLLSLLDQAVEKEKARVRNRILAISVDVLQQNLSNIDEWFVAILDSSSIFFDNSGLQNSKMFETMAPDQPRILIGNALRAFPVEQRARLIRNAVRHADDISLLCQLFRSLAGDAIPSGVSSLPEGLGEHTHELRAQLVDRVVHMSRDGTLLTQARPADLLWFWWGAGHEAAVRRFTSKLTRMKDGLRTLLTIAVSVVMANDGNHEHVNRESWEKVVDLSLLELRAIALESQGDDEDKTIAQRFLDALGRRT